MTFTLDTTVMTTWAQTLVDAVSGPLAIIAGVSIGGLIVGRVRGLF